MADAKFEDVKKEIRSLLISYQKGTSLSEFRKEYKSFIGRWLPFQDFGFKDEYSFLKAMPDAVKIYPSPVAGDYHLMGVADDSIKHIQKMVCKQKTSKHKTRYRAPRAVSYAYSSAPSYSSNYSSSQGRAYSRNYVVPPRFTKKELPKGVDKYVIHMLNKYPSGVKLGQFLDVFCQHYNRQFTFKDWGFSTLEECLETIPDISAKNKNNDIIVHLLKRNVEINHQTNCAPVEHKAVFKDIINQPSKNCSQPSHAELSPLNPNALDFFDRDFNKKGNKSDSLKVTSTSGTLDNFLINKNKSDSLKESTSGLSDNFLINRMIQDSCSQSALEESSYSIEEPFQPQGASSNHTSSSHKIRDHNNQPTYQSSKVDHSSSTHTSSSHKIHDHDNPPAYQSSKVDRLDDFPISNFKDKPATNHSLCDDFDDKYPFAFDSPLIKEPKDTSDSGVSRIVRDNLIKMIDNYPHGIFAVKFSSCYEKVTGTNFDLHSLGFNNLSELVDAVPDILVRKPYKGSKKDWIICSADSVINEATAESGPAECSVLFVECIILNIRKILQANPEGVPLSTFIYNYSINCTEPLYIQDLGFDNLEDFLLSIASRVPLDIINTGGEKVVQLVSFQGIIKPPVSPLLQKPADIAPLDAKFTPYELPPDFVYTDFHPVYTSSIANPGLLYIQFEGEENSEALKILYDEIEAFYRGEASDSYKMKPSDIKLGVACIALWPFDKCWYRARITSIVSLDFVQVFYEDYGTTDEVPLNMLRYIKKDYMKLPSQAIKSCLGYLKPFAMPGQSTVSWDKRTRRRMLELCQDKPLMARIDYIFEDGVYAVVLCDTSIENQDIYINDVLVRENLAEVLRERDDPRQLTPPVVSPQDTQKLIAELITRFSLANASNIDLINQLHNFSLNVLPNQTPLGFPPQQSLPPMCEQFPNISPLISPNFNSTIPSFGNTAASIPPPRYPPGLNIKFPDTALNVPNGADISEHSPSDPSPPSTPSPDDGEIFDEDDDEFFEQWCEKNIDAKKRYVKRVKTTDGYVFHVLLHDSQPYVSSGDLSILIWHAKAPSCLFHKVQALEIKLASTRLMEKENEEFFTQLERFKVKGIDKMGSESSVLLYPLSEANQILNLFGHPSATLRARINTEITTFKPSSSHWQELSDSEIPEEVEDVRIVTDDDKMNRLCLYDLKTMREGIRFKRLNLVKRKEVERTNQDLDEEINKLNQLSNKVRERIIEIDQIISMFSDRKR